jgi:hypothetical protein
MAKRKLCSLRTDGVGDSKSRSNVCFFEENRYQMKKKRKIMQEPTVFLMWQPESLQIYFLSLIINFKAFFLSVHLNHCLGYIMLYVRIFDIYTYFYCQFNLSINSFFIIRIFHNHFYCAKCIRLFSAPRQS